VTEHSSGATGLFGIRGRVAVITGGAGLLGIEHAEALAGCGADVVLCDREQGRCEARAVSLAEKHGVRALGRACDVTQPSAWAELVKDVVETLGRIDILVNNAAATNDSRSVSYGAPFVEYPLEDWDAVLGVNVTGSFLGCQAVGAHMLDRGSVSIINVASLYGVVSPHHPIYAGTGVVQPVAYSVSKAAVLGLTRYLATLWAGQGVRVNAITPGGVFRGHSEPFLSRYNALSPIGRMAEPHEMRGAVAYLASDASSYCTGHNLVVDGGWTAW